MAEKDIMLQDKKEVQSRAESTRTLPVFVPAVDIYESPGELVLLADMPGVAIDDVSIDLDNDQLTIHGKVEAAQPSGTLLLNEYSVGDYYRQFTVSNVIDRSKIEASMKDGVLKIVLPKSEALKPRRITVQSS